ncbi:MAG: histidine phosphatase family protein [Pseudomonadota bacterium]
MTKDQTESPAAKADLAPARIIIVRHGRPNLNRNLGPRLDWSSYREWWARYEKASLDEGQSPSEALVEATSHAPFIYASIRPRAIETAQAFANGREVRADPTFVEAPLPPPHLPRGLKFLPKNWNMIARACWLFGYADGDESIDEARARADAAADRLISAAQNGHDVVLAAHGWFNRMLRPALKRRNWTCVRDGGDSYWSFRVYEHRG